MRIETSKLDLLKGLALTQSVIEKRGAVPILSYLLLEAIPPHTLKITGTDLEHTVTTVVAASIDTPDLMTVNAGVLYELVRRFNEEFPIVINFDSAKLQMNISSGKSYFNLTSLPTEGFPLIKNFHSSLNFQLPSSTIKELIDQTRFAICQEETRYALNGLYWHIFDQEKPVLRMVATDIHRLAKAELPIPRGAESMRGIILSRKTIGEVRKLAELSEGDIQIQLSQNQIGFIFPSATLIARLIDGTYPDYDHVLQIEGGYHLSVETKRFLEVARRISVVVQGKAPWLKLRIEHNQLSIQAQSQELGEAFETLTVESDVELLEIGFNAHYLIEIIQQIKSDSMLLRFTSAISPVIIYDGSVKEILYVLMPMRI